MSEDELKAIAARERPSGWFLDIEKLINEVRRLSAHRCDQYELLELPGVSFCRKGGARIVGEKLQDAQRALAEAQARELVFRQTLERIGALPTSSVDTRAAKTAVTNLPPDDAALRAFAQRVASFFGHGLDETDMRTVLKGAP